jgi:hypothetical protein
MNIGTQVTFNVGFETKTGEIIWLSLEFAWVKNQATNEIHKILITDLT